MPASKRNQGQLSPWTNPLAYFMNKASWVSFKKLYPFYAQLHDHGASLNPATASTIQNLMLYLTLPITTSSSLILLLQRLSILTSPIQFIVQVGAPAATPQTLLIAVVLLLLMSYLWLAYVALKIYQNSHNAKRYFTTLSLVQKYRKIFTTLLLPVICDFLLGYFVCRTEDLPPLKSQAHTRAKTYLKGFTCTAGGGIPSIGVFSYILGTIAGFLYLSLSFIDPFLSVNPFIAPQGSGLKATTLVTEGSTEDTFDNVKVSAAVHSDSFSPTPPSWRPSHSLLVSLKKLLLTLLTIYWQEMSSEVRLSFFIALVAVDIRVIYHCAKGVYFDWNLNHSASINAWANLWLTLLGIFLVYNGTESVSNGIFWSYGVGVLISISFFFRTTGRSFNSDDKLLTSLLLIYYSNDIAVLGQESGPFGGISGLLSSPKYFPNRKILGKLIGILSKEFPQVPELQKKYDELIDPKTHHRLNLEDLEGNLDEYGSSVYFNPVYIKYFIKERFQDLLKRDRENIQIRFFLVSFLFLELNFIQLAIIYILGFKKDELSFFTDFNLYRLNTMIAKHLSSLNKNEKQDSSMSSLDIENLVQIEKNFYQLSSGINHFSETYFTFLDQIISSSPDIKRLEEDNMELCSLRQQIHEVYNRYLSSNPRSMILYSNFSRVFLFQSKKSSSIRKFIDIYEEKVKAYKQEDLLFYDINLMFTQRSTIIQLGAGNDNLGRIMKVNVGASLLTKYSINELLSSNVNRIMANFIAKRHQSYLQRAFKRGEFIILYREQRNYLVDKGGYCVPISLLIKPMYEIGTQLFQYISYIQPLSTNAAYILTDPLGRIESYSESLASFFDLSPKEMLKEQVYIQSLIPLLIDFFLEKYLVNQGGVDTIENFMEFSHYLQTYPVNIHSDYRARLFCYDDQSKLPLFQPQIFSGASNNTSSLNRTCKKTAEFSKIELSEEISLKQIEAYVADLHQCYFKWRKDHGLTEGVIYDIDLSIRLLRTTTCYGFVFQIRNPRLFKKANLSTSKFSHELANPCQSSRINDSGQEHHPLLRKKTSPSEKATSVLLESLPAQNEEEKNLLRMVADIFTQQDFFKASEKTNKRFEFDSSESMQSISESEVDCTNYSLSDGSLSAQSQGGTMSIVSDMSSISTKTINDGEMLTRLPDREYLPRSFHKFRLMGTCFAFLSTLATITTVVYGGLKSRTLEKEIDLRFMFNQIDTILLRDYIYGGLLSKEGLLDKEESNSVMNSLKESSQNVKKLLRVLKTETTKSAFLVGIYDKKIKVEYWKSSYLPEYEQNYIEFIETETFMARHGVIDFFSKTLPSLSDYLKIHRSWDWYKENLILNISMSSIQGFCFLLAVFLALAWICFVSKAMDYLNGVYSMMVSFPHSAIHNHKHFVLDLSKHLENKIDDKKMARKIKKNMQRAEEKKKQDVGLKTTFKAILYLSKPKLMLGLTIFLLLALVAGFNTTILINMGIFLEGRSLYYKVNEGLVESQLSLNVLAASHLSKLCLTQDERLGSIPRGQVHTKTYEDILDKATISLQNQVKNLDSVNTPKYDQYMQVFFGNACTLYPEGVFGTLCRDSFEGILQNGVSSALIFINLAFKQMNHGNITQGLGTNTTLSDPHLHRLKDLLFTVLMVDNLIKTSIHDLSFELKDKITAIIKGSIWKNSLLLVGAIFLFFFFWLRMIQGFHQRMSTAKNVISLLPSHILSQNMRVSKYMQEVFNETNKNG